MTLAAIVFGLVAAISWGLADFLAAKAAKRLGGLLVGYMISTIAAVAFGVVYLLFFRSQTTFDAIGLSYGVASGAAFLIANLSFYKGLEHGPVSIVSPFGSLYPLVTTLLLVALFGVHLGVRQGVGIGIVMLGVAAASGLFEKVKHSRRLSRGPLLGLTAAAFWGIAWALIARAVERIGWQLTSLVELWTAAILFVPLLPWLNKTEPGLFANLKPSLKSAALVGSALLMVCGFLSLSIGLDKVANLATTMVVLSAFYPVLTVFLALRHLNERLAPIPLVGALAAVGGVAILSLG